MGFRRVSWVLLETARIFRTRGDAARGLGTALRGGQEFMGWEGGRSGYELFSLQGHDDWVYSAAYSLDGQRIVTASFNKTAKIWDSDKGQGLMSLAVHQYGITSAAYSPCVSDVPSPKPKKD